MSNPTCAVEDCAKPAYRHRSMCNTHYFRMYRYGDLESRARKAAPVRINSGGYRKLHRPGHPLSDREGYAYEHRLVLWDAIGWHPQWCHWCDEVVEWFTTLEVDHVDHDRLNNDLSNLVPSCHACNTGRALCRRWHGEECGCNSRKAASE